MELLTKELREQIPPIGSQEHIDDPLVRAKFFTPDSGWTWYVIEGSALVGEMQVPLAESNQSMEDDVLFFGYVIGQDCELGYFSLNELASIRGPFNLPVERDIYFEPEPLSVIKKKHERECWR